MYVYMYLYVYKYICIYNFMSLFERCSVSCKILRFPFIDPKAGD